MRVSLDDAGTVVQRDDYYPFGMGFQSFKSGLENNYQYNQGIGDKTFETERQVELELDMTKLRMYDYTLGRFTSVDPLADAVGQEVMTPYHYAGSNPVRYSDPYGDCFTCLWTVFKVVSENHPYGAAGVIWDAIVNASPAGTMKRTEDAARNYISNEIDYGLNRGRKIQQAIDNNEDPDQVKIDYEYNKAVAKYEIAGVYSEWMVMATGGAMASLERIALVGVTQAARGGSSTIMKEMVENILSDTKGSADDIAARFTDSGYKTTVKEMRTGRGYVLTVEGHSTINTIKIHGGGGRHGAARLQIQGQNNLIDLKIVSGSESSYKGNLAEEIAAGREFIFLNEE